MGCIARLQRAMEKHHSLVCVGLDPDPARLPAVVQATERPQPLFRFNKAIIDATADLVCAYKPQAAYYHAQAAEEQLALTIDYIRQTYPDIPVILDAKRGDIGHTAIQYAKEAFERYRADAVTVNPYMGTDTVAPFTRYRDKGVAILCRTSNPSAGAIQQLQLADQRCMYQAIAEQAVQAWNQHGNVLLVVGATQPEALRQIRTIVGDMPLLVPGFGAQGGDIALAVQYGLNSQGVGLIVNAARSILYASQGDDFADAARQATQALRERINQYR